MTLHDVALAQGYWRRNPPLRVLAVAIAASLGIPPDRLTPAKTVKDLTAADYDLTPKSGHMTLEQMEPFGSGNPAPVLLADDLQVVGEPKCVGKTEGHLSFKVRQQSKELKAIAFNLADRAGDLMSREGRCCLAFTPRLNEYNGFKSIEIVVKDFQPGPKATLGG